MYSKLDVSYYLIERGIMSWSLKEVAVDDLFCCNRIATAQEKQGIWMLIFPDKENAGN